MISSRHLLKVKSECRQISAWEQVDNMIKNLILLGCIAALAGCQAMIFGTADDLNKIQIGMTKEQVIAAIGKPNAISADADKREESLSFKRMSAEFGWMPAWYDVVLVDGKVARFGEQQG